jgi:hypothetical protein
MSANSLHAAWQLLHRGVKLFYLAVIFSPSGLRAQKALRDVAVAYNAARSCVPGKRVWLHFFALLSVLT